MVRTIAHDFDPPSASPVVGPDVQLSVQEIEDAALREILQTPGAGFASWTILDRLLAPGSPFMFVEPLGQSREVKIALSGLYGRFVARAYLERYFGLSVFSHVVEGAVVLNGQLPIQIERKFGGDLPDWIACSASLSDLTVAEAKGCHDKPGPAYALARAWEQANRIDVFVAGHPTPAKRIAVATRWGVAMGGPRKTIMAVYDPVDEGDPAGDAEQAAVFVGLFRYHIANLISSLGHVDLARSIREIAMSQEVEQHSSTTQRARALLDRAGTEELPQREGGDSHGLVGGFVTRAGPLAAANATRVDWQTLNRFDLRPTFVGVERELIHAVIVGDHSGIRETLTARPAVPQTARSDQAGGWIVPLGDEEVYEARE